jgi:septation ring formation regulator EzrA
VSDLDDLKKQVKDLKKESKVFGDDANRNAEQRDAFRAECERLKQVLESRSSQNQVIKELMEQVAHLSKKEKKATEKCKEQDTALKAMLALNKDLKAKLKQQDDQLKEVAAKTEALMAKKPYMHWSRRVAPLDSSE